MKQYTFYIFDMGSTLLEFHNPIWNEDEILKTGHKRMITHVANIYGQPIADKINKEVILPWYDYVENESKIKRIEYRICEALFLKFYELGIHISYKEIIEILKKDYLDFYNYAHPNEGVIDCLKLLKAKECKIGVVSNIMYPQEIYIEIFNRVWLDTFIDNYTFSYENTYMKPNPSIFLRSAYAAKCENF
ncbi:HAD family hydrolase [Treponema sp. OMZ 788]|uniref:HAD family hydrolase n=1 Tax=Treponema sp. OMZ 788 TaxID=2563664 RepID=UPI0020A5441A|nr:HAD family hydrolase [Treponema sp. OMZ 788]